MTPEELRVRFEWERDKWNRAFQTATDALKASIYAEVAAQAMEVAAAQGLKAQEAWEAYQAALGNDKYGNSLPDES